MVAGLGTESANIVVDLEGIMAATADTRTRSDDSLQSYFNQIKAIPLLSFEEAL